MSSENIEENIDIVDKQPIPIIINVNDKNTSDEKPETCIDYKLVKPCLFTCMVLDVCNAGCTERNCDDCCWVFLPITFIVDLITLPCTSTIWCICNKKEN
jgi:hypothetical protein